MPRLTNEDFNRTSHQQHQSTTSNPSPSQNVAIRKTRSDHQGIGQDSRSSSRADDQRPTFSNDRRYDHKRNTGAYSRFNRQNQQPSHNQHTKHLGSSDSLSRFSQSSAQSSPTGYDSPMRNFETLTSAPVPPSNQYQVPSQPNAFMFPNNLQPPPQLLQQQHLLHQQHQIDPQLHHKAFQTLQVSQGIVGGEFNAHQVYMHQHGMMPYMGFHPSMPPMCPPPPYMMAPFGQQIVYFMATPDN